MRSAADVVVFVRNTHAVRSPMAPWIALSLGAAVLVAAASAAGIYVPDVYAKETASWAAQGVGQDIVNLFVVVPALLVCLSYVRKGSLRAVLVWFGLLIYVIYSYLLYAFFVHFNVLFLVYVSVLGLSFWAVLGVALSVDRDDVAIVLDHNRRFIAPAVYLMASGLLFGALWLSDIVPALASGTTPRDVNEVGLPVNPVHVLDLAFILPAMIATSILLRRRHILGFLFAVPLLTFAATMGAAIVGMAVVMDARGLGAATGVVGVFAVLIPTALWLTYSLLTRCSADL